MTLKAYEKVSVNYIWKISVWLKVIHLSTDALFEYLTCVDAVIPLDYSWSWDNIWLLIRRAWNKDNILCVYVCVLSVCSKSLRVMQSKKWHLNGRFPADTWVICTCPFSVKANKLERLCSTMCLSGLAIIQLLGWATVELRAWRYKRRVARSRSLVVWSLTVM